MARRVATLESLFTANVEQIDKAEQKIKVTGQRIESKPITATVKADERNALAGMDRVEQSAKRIVSADTVARVDANIARGEKNLARIQGNLEYLRSVETELDVRADISRAESSLSKVQRNLDGLKAARTTLEVRADTGAAESELDQLPGKAGKAGSKAGEDAGAEFSDSIIAALASIPIAGAVIGVGAAAAKGLLDAFQDGLAQEAGYDRLAALTGLSESDALRVGRAAGEAYANNFGESIEKNMDTARIATQFQLISWESSTLEAQKVVQGLSGIADVLDEDVRPTATAVTTLLRSGMAKSAQDAFDILAAGAREGVNRSEDLLDTFTEYPVVLTKLGLTGDQMLGLLNQGLRAGARNSDVVADALKEFQIRATDASTSSSAGFKAIGLDAEDMTARIARGGKDASDGLQLVLDRLRETEDPVVRNSAAVALFGTKAEDLGDALFALDTRSAVEQLDGVTGAAERMFDTIADNDATRVQRAQRNIEVAADGIKGALAAAFSEPVGDFADFVSENRGPVLQFFLDMANGALDFAESAIDGTGAFVSGPLAEMISGLAVAIKFFNWFADTSELDALAEEMRGFTDTTDVAADAIDQARQRLNEFGDGAVAMGYLNDASLRTASAIDAVGVAADGSRASLDGIDLAHLSATESGRALESQVRGAIAALSEEVSAAESAGAAQGELTDRYRTATDALVEQLTQMGITEEQARALISTVLQTPESATTTYGSNAQDEQGKVQALADRITTLPDGSIVITADTGPARRSLDWLISSYSNYTVPLRPDVAGAFRGIGGGHHGGIVQFMASGGIPDLTPMSSVASMVPANTWRVVGDRGDVPEAFIPMDGSQRSRSILDEANRMMPGSSSSTMSTEVNVHLHNPITRDLEQDAWDAAQIIGGVIRV